MAVKVALLGASGRLGRIARAGLSGVPDLPLQIVPQVRRRPASPSDEVLVWSSDEGLEALTLGLRGVDAVINLIGVTHGAGQAELQRVNVDLARHVVSAARAAGVRRIMLASSAAVYGKPADPARPFEEGDELAPVSDYGRSKAAMEAAVPKGDDLTILRIGNVAGADALLGQVMAPWGSTNRIVDFTLDRFADGRGPRRSYIGPAGFARMLGALVLEPGDLPATLNLAAPPPLAMEDMLNAWRTARPDALHLTWREAHEGALAQVCLSTDRLASTLDAAVKPVTAESVVKECLDMEIPN